MKHTLITIALILLAACAPTSTSTTIAPSATPTVTVEPTKFSTPTLTSTPEPSKTPTTMPTITATPRPELSWQPAFNMLVNLLSERATLGKDGVFVDNLKHNDQNGDEAKPVPLDGSFGVALKFDYQGNGYGSLNLSGVPSPNPWWKGLIRLWVKSEKGVVHLDISDGTSETRVGYFPLQTLDPNSRFYIFFSDAQGKRFAVLNEKGETLQEVDVTKVGQGVLANGLFPQRKMYAGFNITPDSQMTAKEFSLLAPATSNLFSLYAVKELAIPSLRELAKQRGFTLGTEIDARDMEYFYDARYKNIVAQEFGAVVSSYGFSWAFDLHPSSSEFNWTRADEVTNFAKSKGLGFSVASLLFTSEKPPAWLANGNFSNDQLLALMENHIKTIMKRYKGTISEWQVVSEADITYVRTDGGVYAGFPTTKFWNAKLGPDVYIEKSFRWAREADPNAILIYNSDNNETICPASDVEYDFLTKMKQKGVPIDGIGMEMNLQASNFKTDADIATWKASVVKNMRRFADLGLGVYITELNVNVGNVEGKTRDEKLALQAKIYKAAIETCLESGACKTVYLGGFTDNTSWIFYPSYPYGKPEAPNILDEHYNPKPAYFAIRDALARK